MKNNIIRRGLLLVLSSPSGAGKSTLSRLILEKDNEITMSVSTTTRTPRKGETEGVDYYFKSKDEFESLIEKDGFLEYAKVFDNYYGSPAAPVEDALEKGMDVLFDVDWQGTQQLSQKMKNDLVRVFILPPSKKELLSRLTGRGQDSKDVINSRMQKASAEISHWAEYDYIIVNDNLQQAEKELIAILAAERLKRSRQTGLVGFVKELMSNSDKL